MVTADHWTFIIHFQSICIVLWVENGFSCLWSDVSPSFLLQQHNSRVEEPSNSRPLSDRKRKFVDSELAQDTEGKITDVKNTNM